MRHPLITFLLFTLLVVIVVGILFKISHDKEANLTDPEVIATYAQAVPGGYTTGDIIRVVDPSNAGVLLEPTLAVVKVSDNIQRVSCPNLNPECTAKAFFIWTRNEIEYTEVLFTREYIISPQETIAYREGNSLTKSILLAAMLRAHGFHAKVGHTPYVSFTETIVSGITVRLDPACAQCNWGSTRYKGSDDTILWIE